jgi:predicted ATPase
MLARDSRQASEAEAAFHRAFVIASGQNSKSWELRAALSLGRLWRQQGKRDEAALLLNGVYDWFTEGFDTSDLRDAKKFIDELRVGCVWGSELAPRKHVRRRIR